MLSVLKIRHSERWLAIVAALVAALLNALTVMHYYGAFSTLSGAYHRLFVRTFHISGFDPLTYEVLSQWTPAYNVYRHPLLAFFLWPLNQVNQGLILVTGHNWAAELTALMMTVCAMYACLFLFRILHEVIGATRRESHALCALFFGFAFVMLATMVPDHFALSMTALLLTLYVAGVKLRRGSALNAWQTVGLFLLTAGVSLNNGLKIFLAALVTRRRRFFRPVYLLLAVILPALLIWGFARWEYRVFVWPKEMARAEMRQAKTRQHMAELRREVADSLGSHDSAAVERVAKVINRRQALAKYRSDHKKIWNRNAGQPIAKGEFLRWTDISTPRLPSIVENLLGEGIQLHEDHLLGDVLRDRPVIVHYRHAANYIAEALIALLFMAGVWRGRRSLLLWTAMSFFIMDMALHLGLGFGLNEIYIMSPHYLFVIPIAAALLLTTLPRRQRRVANALVIALAAWLWIWNVGHIVAYMS